MYPPLILANNDQIHRKFDFLFVILIFDDFLWRSTSGRIWAVERRDREIIWRRFFFFKSKFYRLLNEVCLDLRFRVFSARASTWNIRISKKNVNVGMEFVKISFWKRVKKNWEQVFASSISFENRFKVIWSFYMELLQFQNYFPPLLPNVIILKT